MSKFWNRYKPKKDTPSNKDYTSISVALPKEQFEVLKHYSHLAMTPISRLVAYAIDNELDAKVPFHYPVEQLQTTFVKHAYTDEAHKLFEFLKRFPSGLSRDSLLLFRRSIGIPNKLTLLLGLRELFETGLIHETTKKPKANKFEYHPSTTWIRVRKVQDGTQGSDTGLSETPDGEST